MAMPTPQQASDKLKRAIQNGGTSYKEGVMRVTESPMQKAVDNQQKLVQNWMQAVNDGKWARNLLAVPLTEWKTRTSEIGSSRYTQGADKAATNYKKFADEFFPHVASVQAEVQAMPSLTLDDNIARMVANARGMARFSRR